MIKPNELMLGNLIQHNGVVLRVMGIRAATVRVLPLDEFPADESEWGELPLSDVEAIPFAPEWLLKFGFEKKELYGWRGNGQDWQPETQKTEYQDYVLRIGEDDDFFIRYETMSYRETERDEWISYPVSVSVHRGEWYEKANCDIGCTPIQTIHRLQNLFLALSGKQLLKLENV